MKTHTTLSLLAASALCAFPAFAEDAAPTPAAKAWVDENAPKNYVLKDLQTLDRWNSEMDTFIPFEQESHRSAPPLTPGMIPGGFDEARALSVHHLNRGSTPLVAQNRPYRAVDAYRQYAVHQSGGNANQSWSAEEWEAYGAQFRQSVEGPDGFDPCQRIRVRQFIASGPVRFENEQGRTLFEGYNAFISDRATLRTGAFLFTLEPELRLHNGTRTGYDPRFDARLTTGPNTFYGVEDRNGLAIMEATAQVDIYGAHLTIGRQALVWGPGVHQQLLLSANAAPMWMAHLTSSEPMALPGAGSKLGYFSPEVFFARTDDDRPNKDTWVSGVRLGWQATPYLKMGLNLVSTFGSNGRGINGRDLFFNLTSSDGDTLPNATSDQKCSWDFRLLSPWKSAPLELYMENGYETRHGWSDVSSFKKGWRRPAWLAGVHLPKLDQGGILSATFEYAWTGPSWYIANGYNSATLSSISLAGQDYAYRYQGQNLGAPMGGDAESFYAELRAKLAPGVQTVLSGGFEEHGLNAPVTERLLQTKLRAEVDLGHTTGLFNGWHAEGSVAWDRWSNFQGVRDNTQNGVAVGLGLRKGF